MDDKDLKGRHKDELNTPVLLVDLDIFAANMAKLAAACQANNIAWRPHSKAHKSPDIARLELAAGARGITCAKLSEADLMVDHGIDEILIANQIVSSNKLEHLARLQQKSRVIATVDQLEVVEIAARAAGAVGATIPLLIDIDIGMHRTGVEPGAAVLELGRAIEAAPHLELAGIMGYEGHVLDIEPPQAKITACHQALELLVKSRDALLADGLPCAIVSAGGTGCYKISSAFPGLTELQAGGGVFMDAMYREVCNVDDLDFALTVLATVTSRSQSHLVVDAGFKVWSAYHHPPQPKGRDDLKLRYLSAEHGVFDIEPGTDGPAVGDRLEFIVGYSDSTTFLHDQFTGIRRDVVEEVWPILGRGKFT